MEVKVDNCEQMPEFRAAIIYVYYKGMWGIYEMVLLGVVECNTTNPRKPANNLFRFYCYNCIEI